MAKESAGGKKFTARYTASDGSRKEKHFDKRPEARNWLADAQYADKHGTHQPTSEITVDAWFDAGSTIRQVYITMGTMFRIGSLSIR